MDVQTLFSQIKDEFVKKTERSAAYYQQALAVMPGGNTRTVNFHHPYLLSIEKGQGALIWDADGNKYIDFVNNYTSLIHGHSHPQVLEKINDTLPRGTSYGALIPEQVELAEVIKSRIKSIELIRFCNSGTEAALFGIRLARAYTKRPAIIKISGGYHGAYDDVEGLVGQQLVGDQLTRTDTLDKGIPTAVADQVYEVPFNDLEAMETVLKKYHQQVAAMIVEPMLGAGGVIPPQEGYLSGLRQLADRYNVLLIFDEVQTFRLSTGGAQEKYNVSADITILGKIIGGGFPIGAFGGKGEIMALLDQNKGGSLTHNGTHNGNRISMAAGLATLQLFQQKEIDQLERLSEKLHNGLNEVIAKYALPACVTREGSLLNLHFVKTLPTNYEETHSPLNELRALVHLDLLNHGIFTIPRGMLNLSTAITAEQIETTIKVFDEVMGKLSKVV